MGVLHVSFYTRSTCDSSLQSSEQELDEALVENELSQCALVSVNKYSRKRSQYLALKVDQISVCSRILLVPNRR